MVQIEEIEVTSPPQQGCAYCSEQASSKVCSLCRDVAYCSQGCQQAHWKVHRKECARKHAPLPKDPPKIENPCVCCGKQGILQNSGSWYCSHDCCSSNVDDLTSQIRQMNSQRREGNEERKSLEAKESDAARDTAKEFNRIKDFIASSRPAPARSVEPVEESTPGVKDPNENIRRLIEPRVKDPNEHIRRLIESQNRQAGICEPAPRDAELCADTNDELEEASAEDALEQLEDAADDAALLAAARRLRDARSARREKAAAARPASPREAAKRGGVEDGKKTIAPAPKPHTEHGAHRATEAKATTHPVLQKIQEHQEALNNLEKAKQDHQRFTEWVQWAHGEIQAKKQLDEDDGA